MSYTLVLEWMPGDLYMSAVTARCTAPTSSYSVVWLPPNKVYQITLYCGSTSLVSFLVGAFRGKAWSYMSVRNEIKAQIIRAGYTMQEAVDLLHEEYGWSDSVSNLSAKLQRESIRYKEVMELADVLGYDLVWVKRRDER